METKLNEPLATNRKFPPYQKERANKNKSSRKKPSVAVVGDSCCLQYVEGRESMSHQQVFEAGCRRNLA